jgi:hypothetical protein
MPKERYTSGDDYHDESDIPKIITLLESTSIKNGWDANINSGAGDGGVRIPARFVRGFVEMLRSRPLPSPEEQRLPRNCKNDGRFSNCHESNECNNCSSYEYFMPDYEIAIRSDERSKSLLKCIPLCEHFGDIDCCPTKKQCIALHYCAEHYRRIDKLLVEQSQNNATHGIILEELRGIIEWGKKYGDDTVAGYIKARITRIERDLKVKKSG